MVMVMMRQSKFHHLKETTHHWRRNWYLIFVFWPPEYFIVSKRTQLNALKSNSTNMFRRFESYRPECVQTPWVRLCSEQERRWDCSSDKGLSVLFLLMKYSIEGGVTFSSTINHLMNLKGKRSSCGLKWHSNCTGSFHTEHAFSHLFYFVTLAYIKGRHWWETSSLGGPERDNVLFNRKMAMFMVTLFVLYLANEGWCHYIVSIWIHTFWSKFHNIFLLQRLLLKT